MDKLSQYLLEHIPERNETFQKLEEYARTHRVPIIEPVSMNFLTQLVKMNRPKQILELGTAIGYSALRMLEAYPLATITTIERNEEMFQIATRNIENADKSDRIQMILGDALEIIQQLSNEQRKYDFIFIDAAKAQYQRFFTNVEPLLNDGGIIVCDNVLFKGYVANSSKANSRRMENLATKIRLFNEWLMAQSNYHTSIIPIGDGLSISIKIK